MLEIAQQLHAAGLNVFPCRADKSPAVSKGQPWAEVAKQPPESLRWPSGVVGVPVPPGVVVLDLDTYKGVTREQVEALLGCSLPWDRALIQTTQRGGQHYAFKAPQWPVRQDSNVSITGFDTRVGTKGYIATGAGYTPIGFGLFALAHPEALAELPDACRPTLEHVQRSVEHTPLPEGDKDAQTVRDALSRIPPSVGRSEWMRVGLALRHYFHDDEQVGMSLFDEWSSGGLTPEHDTPANYAGPEDIEHQFTSFKPEGGTTISTLFYAAMQNGWRPPAGIDVSSAFGPGAAPVDAFCEMIDRIQETGGDPKQTSELITALGAMPCDQLQRATLLATLTRELKDAGLLSKGVKQQIDGLSGAPSAPKAQPQKPAPGQFLPANTPLHSDMWAKFHTKGTSRKPKGTRENFDILTAAYGIGIRYNVISKQVEVAGPGIDSQGDMVDNAALGFIESQAELNEFPNSRVAGCVVTKANSTPYNPVTEWVESVPWDGFDHVGALTQQITLSEGEDGNVAAALFRKWMRGAVAVGTGYTDKMEYVLTLVDPAGGRGKTRFFNTLCPPALQSEGVTLDPANKDSVKHAVSYWLVELGELDATFSRADQARLKAHLSNNRDELRMPYAKTADKFARRTAYFGSVNTPEFLVDASGNRRFWPIRIDSINYEHNVNMQQVWAQALFEVRAGEIWHLTPQENDVVSLRNNEFRVACSVEDALSTTYDPAQRTAEHHTVSQCLKNAGIFSPTKGDLNAGGAWLRRNGFRKTKNNGITGYWLPAASTAASKALGPALTVVK